MFRSPKASLTVALSAVAPLLFMTAAPALAGDAAAGESQFRRCMACHQVGDGAANRVGPQLNGLVGRQIAGVADFANYSDELSALNGETWNEENLAEYIANPAAFIGASRSAMPPQRMRPEQMDDLIAYLSTL